MNTLEDDRDEFIELWAQLKPIERYAVRGLMLVFRQRQIKKLRSSIFDFLESLESKLFTSSSLGSSEHHDQSTQGPPAEDTT